MANMVTIRQLTKTLRPLGETLRAAAMVIVMVLSPIGVTFQPCQCSCGQDDKSCCCSSETSSCCSSDCGCGCENPGVGCSCIFCMCTFRIEVEPTSLINDSVNPMVFTTTISLTSSKPSLAALLRPDRTAVTPHAHLYSLHCRWLI